MSCNWDGFVKSGDWYIHEPTRRASNSLMDLLSYEDVRHYLWSCYHPESGIKSGDGFGDPMDAFLKYLEGRVHDKTTPLA